MASKLSEHEQNLLNLAKDAQVRYPRHDYFKSWLRGFMKPGRGSAELRSKLKELLEDT